MGNDPNSALLHLACRAFLFVAQQQRGSRAMLTATRRSATTKHSSSPSTDQGGGKRRGIYAEHQLSGLFLSFKCLTRATNGAWP
jgi:hypothetical protein